MNEINKTLYIPLYGKSQVSKKGIILQDEKAEQIWQCEQFPLKGKSKSKWLAYFMSMRAKVFDEWVCCQTEDNADTVVLHIGCGMDSRYFRINSKVSCWYDIDFPQVIAERRKYYTDNEHYIMLGGNAADPKWVGDLQQGKRAVIILEGISMYLRLSEIQALFEALAQKYENVSILMDVYTDFGAKASKYKNPINDVGVTKVYGIDDPESVIKNGCVRFVKEHDMAPDTLVNELKGFERWFFSLMFAGKLSKKMYRLFEYTTEMLRSVT